MKNLFNFFRKNEIGEPPWEYNFLVNLDEKEYPKYLAKIFKYRTGEKLPLRFDFKQQAWVIDKKKCKTFNQKIQWIKLYSVTDLMRMCTDKVAVRDYVAEKIGSEYLKPVLQIIPDTSLQVVSHCEAQRPLKCRSNPADKENLNNINFKNKNIVTNRLDCHGSQNVVEPRNDRLFSSLLSNFDDVSTYFDQIQWDKLPNAFVIKTNHGSKWQYIIKDKEDVLNTKPVVDLLRKNITGWLEQEYFPWNGFEMQYRGIKQKILIEPLLQENINENSESIQLYCFNGKPKYIEHLYSPNRNKISIYDENLEITSDLFDSSEDSLNILADEIVKQTFDLSAILTKNFQFARIDWMLYKNKPYFEEMTFTPYSGFWHFKNKKKHLNLGNLLNLQGENNGF